MLILLVDPCTTAHQLLWQPPLLYNTVPALSYGPSPGPGEGGGGFSHGGVGGGRISKSVKVIQTAQTQYRKPQFPRTYGFQNKRTPEANAGSRLHCLQSHPKVTTIIDNLPEPHPKLIQNADRYNTKHTIFHKCTCFFFHKNAGCEHRLWTKLFTDDGTGGQP